MARRLWISLIGVVLIVVVALGLNLATGNTPILGLDLQGGVSVILAPVEPASADDLIVIRDLIRDELERRGIAEPDVRVQGETIVVDLPGVRDQQDALSAVDVSGVVELRPVVNFSDCPVDAGAPDLGLGETPVDSTPVGPVAPDDAPTGTVPGDTLPDTSVAPDDAAVGTSVAPSGLRRAVPDPTTPDTIPGDTIPGDTVPDGTVPSDTLPDDIIDLSEFPETPATATATGAALLPTRDGSAVCVGPAQGTGEVFEKGSATLTLDQGYGVSVGPLSRWTT